MRLLRDRAEDLVLPAAVLAESVLTGHARHDFHVRRLLDVVNIPDVDASTAHAAGSLRLASMGAGMKPPPFVTSDDGEFEMLGSLATNAARLSVLVVSYERVRTR
ncbi:MAG TPA: hypothetical protein VM143_12285 [Acidimicrobiales bacterium]|nr:hypothetical protein [Acidimicrobiales bacterium]